MLHVRYNYDDDNVRHKMMIIV